MSVKVFTPEQQGDGNFNGGAILEKKPIPFYHETKGLRPYSNLFYWAHAWSDKGSTIGMHPHKGFEIMSFVLKGDIEHFDTHNNKWLPLAAGDVQIIRAGNGISHSEKINPNSSIFQIWFDPNLEKTFTQPATYDDYKVNQLPVETIEGGQVKIIKGKGSPVQMASEGVEIKEYGYTPGTYQLEIGKDKVASCFLLSGSIKVQGTDLINNDFFLVNDEEKISLDVEKSSVLFVITTPAKLSYKTYLELTN